MTVAPTEEEDLLSAWVGQQRAAATRLRGQPRPAAVGGLRFAFYGRISTADFQDEWSSRVWQRDCAADVVAGRGRIVVEFFDVGCSRSRPRPRRPRAAELLAEVASADRGFDAIVVGEYERAFAGDQLAQLLPLLGRHGVQLWLPELGGPVDAADPAHQALLMLLGHQSRREVLRSRSELWPRCASKRGNRAVTWAAGRRMATVWLTPGRTRTVRMPGGDDG